MKLYQSIFEAITGSIESIEVKDDKERFTASKTIICPVSADRDEIVRIVALLPERDSVELSLIQAVPIIQTSDITHDIDKLVEELNKDLYKGEEIEVKLQIDKETDGGIVSVYDYEAYSAYMTSLNLHDFLNTLSYQLHQGYLSFEVFDTEFNEWSTQTCLVRSYQSQTQPTTIKGEERQGVNKIRERLCHSENAYGSLVVADFLVTKGEQAEDKLQDAFQCAALMFTMMHFYDYSSLSDTEYRFKLCGYKTHAGIIGTSRVGELPFKITDYNDLYLIYKWCYEYGQRDEKMAIARNVLSLNMTFENGNPPVFEIENDIFETVKSNYDFFERDHIRQYVELHAKLNETILGLEDKMIVCVNKFIQEFKTGLFVIASFLTSSVILRFLGKAQNFTSVIFWFSLALIAIYTLSFGYTYWETDKALSQYSDKFDSLKRRYKEILSHKERFELFGDEKVYPHGKGIKFAEQRLKNYSKAWVSMAIILALVVIIAF